MKAQYQGPSLRGFSWFWLLHFSFHLIMAFVAFGAGLFIIGTEGEILPGIALWGAALFAFSNGIAGFRQLFASKKRKNYLNDN
ncbi:hypothetical protein SDC9_04074 [bioreactor metagenome]|uniref:2TM domain-containing protein n=1 Tax=bioreactor metagenome TaxID=1076179 RepID=A0A644SV14_9ZZZZ|nr:hypothetical protein [Negativicutes bacterium]